MEATMDVKPMDTTWLTTDKHPVIRRTQGLDTLNVINHVVSHTHAMITAHIPNMGEYRLKTIQVTEDKQWVLAICVDHREQEFSYWLPWYHKFGLYLGDR